MSSMIYLTGHATERDKFKKDFRTWGKEGWDSTETIIWNRQYMEEITAGKVSVT